MRMTANNSLSTSVWPDLIEQLPEQDHVLLLIHGKIWMNRAMDKNLPVCFVKAHRFFEKVPVRRGNHRRPIVFQFGFVRKQRRKSADGLPSPKSHGVVTRL